LNEAFGLSWKQAPAHTSIRSILIGLAPRDVETAFRAYAVDLDGKNGANGGLPRSGNRRKNLARQL